MLKPAGRADRLGNQSTVEVGAERDAVDTQPIDQIIDMPDHVRERRVARSRPSGRSIVTAKFSPTRPPEFAHRIELAVGQISGHGRDGM